MAAERLDGAKGVHTMMSRLLISWTIAGSFLLAGEFLLAPVDKCTGATGVAPVDPCPQGGEEAAKPKPPMATPEAA